MNAPKTNDASKQIADALQQTAQVSQRAANVMTGNAQAVTEAGGILTHGLQKISSEWLDLAQSRFKMNLEGVSNVLACKTPQDVVAMQSSLVRQNIEQMLDTPSCRSR